MTIWRLKTPKIKKAGAFSLLFVYYTLSVALYVLALPLLCFLSFKQKYKKSIPARFFLKNNPPLEKCDVWFHSCSLGETKAISSLAKKFESRGGSVITGVGYDEALKIGENSRFLPYEMFLPFWIKPVKLLVVMEAELWLALFAVAKLKGAKTALINARISDRSYPKYKRFSFFYRAIFSFVDAVFAQSETDKIRLESLGAKNVFVVGNIKQSIGGYDVKEIKTDEKQNFTAASTHEGEEELIAKAFLDAGLCRKARLIVVPRHPERFETVYTYLSKFASQNSLSISRFSEDETLFADIVLVDKIGELISIYAKSYLVVLGGAFASIGGHNPMEPAYFGAKLISGTHIFNQKSSFEKLKNAYFCEPDELLGLLKNHQELQKSELFGLSDAMGDVEKGLCELLCR